MRRVRVDERRCAAIAAASGLAATFSDASPTGAAGTDAVVVAVSVAATAWLAASAPWWALALVGGIAAFAGFAPVAIGFGTLGAGIAFAIGATQSDASTARTASAGCSLVALCHLQIGGFFGASALIGLGCAGLLIGLGLARRKRSHRRLVRRVAIGLGAFVAIASIAAGASLLGARGGLVEGQEFFEAGVEHLRDGETAAAATDFDRARDAFAAADGTMTRPWTHFARLVPVVAQHRDAGAAAAESGRRASADVGALSAVLDVDALRPESGRFDLDTIRLLADPVSTARRTLVAVGDKIEAVNSPWLIGSLQDQVGTAEQEFADNIGTFDALAAAFDRAPALLGADEPRRYFVAFTTPAEARGTGGFMGNFAVLTADDGLVTLSDFGRTLDLNRGFPNRTVTAPPDWLRRWGRYGFTNGPGGTTGPEPWSNITASPHFPSTAAVIASLFPQSGGTEVDGVIAIDPYVLQSFVGFTGPITIENTDQQVTGNTTAQFLLFDQYAIDSDERKDALEQVATETMTQLLDGALPDPAVLADELGPLVEAERLVAWMAEPDDQALIEEIGLSGALPELDGDTDGFSVVINNAGANKLDAFLTRDIGYVATYDAESAETTVDGKLTITLANSAPTSGLPDGVIGNYVGEDIGTNRSLVTLYTAAPVESVVMDGSPVAKEPGTEAGWNTTTFVVSTAAGAASEIVVQLDGSLRDNDGEMRPLERDPDAANGPGLVVRTQPLVDTPTYLIETVDSDGRLLVDHSGAITGAAWWEPT